MRIKPIIFASMLSLSLVCPAWAEEDMTKMVMQEHGGSTFHMFRLETDYGGSKDGPVATWDLKGWAGSDENKLWLQSEGNHEDGKLQDAEFWALYSRNISTFWDAQAGIRYDDKPTSATYAVIGFNGLAPYFFETEAHAFISNRGDVTARLREENDFLLTQKLIMQPYAEVNLSAQRVPEQDIGSGVTDGKLGLQTRYEFTRKFAPYIDVRYESKFGQTRSFARDAGEGISGFIGSVGLRLMF